MKILGLGIDLLNSKRITQLYSDYGERLAQKILSPSELVFLAKEKFLERKTNFLAKRFSAKEALFKAMGIGMGRGIRLIEVSILGDRFGRPVIVLSEAAAEFAQKLYGTSVKTMEFNVSISDEDSLVNSVVVITCNC
ncbi:MAG: holo-ACP synthase [Rickettsiales bacterium]|jgi:holo-[acyl-carrier protein] synthase|nr:holo-ACP synthase [Rickettsiales bacterium]